MKKILAIAVATAISAPAMADMTIGGSVGIAYGADDNNVKGFNMDSSSLSISASEVVGETTYAVATGIDNLMRGDTTDGLTEGGNASMTISNAAFGTFKVAVLESGGDYGVGGGSADTLNEEVGDNAGGGNLDQVQWKLPTLVDGLSIAATYYDNTAFTNSTDATVDYQFGYTVADVALGLNIQPKTERVRVSAATTLAGLSVAVAHEDNKATSSRTSLGVAMPVNEVSNLGLTYASFKEDGAGTQDGFAVAYDYALSSNLEAVVSYKNYENNTADSSRTAGASATLTLSF
jgi:hypothetical protein